MARTGKLTAIQVAREKGPAILHDGGGLYLRVSEKGSKSWVFRFQLGGKRRDMGLGPFPEISLAAARELAVEHRKRVLAGIDPLTAREAERNARQLADAKARTFKQTAEELIRHRQAGWRNATHRRQWEDTLKTYAYPILGDLPVSAIETGLVMQVLSPIWSSKTETASRLRGRIEAVLDAAKVHGYRDGENPARWRGHLDALLAKPSKMHRVQHHAALPYDELPGFMARLRECEGMGARAVEFAILTATRSGEARFARWSEIDLAAKLWIIPADHMKAGKEHRVPLSDAALAVLEKVRPLAVARDGEPVAEAPLFPGTRRAIPLSRSVMIRVLHRLGQRETVHGFRSSFRDWCAERTGYAREIVEAALAHEVGNPVEQAYRRTDLLARRRQLMDEWARFCASPTPVGEVVPLHAAR